QLYGGDSNVREASEQVAEHQSQGRVEHGAMTVDGAGQVALVGVVAPSLALPHGSEGLLVLIRAGITVVRGHDPRLVDPGPEAIPGGICRGAAVGGARSHNEDAGSARQREVELLGSELRIEDRNVRRGVDAVDVVESPILVKPQVERVEELVSHGDVV